MDLEDESPERVTEEPVTPKHLDIEDPSELKMTEWSGVEGGEVSDLRKNNWFNYQWLKDNSDSSVSEDAAVHKVVFVRHG